MAAYTKSNSSTTESGDALHIFRRPGRRGGAIPNEIRQIIEVARALESGLVTPLLEGPPPLLSCSHNLYIEDVKWGIPWGHGSRRAIAACGQVEGSSP